MLKQGKKLFYDLEKAKQFGDEVNKIASQITVQTGKRTHTSIFGQPYIPNKDDYEMVDKCYYIEKDKSVRDRDVYYVCYGYGHVPKASKADLLQAQRQVKEYLDQKYQELGPDTGISRA